MTPRRPGEKNRNSRCICVIYDLRESIESFCKHCVVAVDENEQPAATWCAHCSLRIQGSDESFFAIEISRVPHNEVCHRVTWRPRRPFNLARHMGGRDSDGQRCIVQGRGSFAAEICSWS